MMKLFKILGVCVGLLAMFLAAYIYLGSLDAARPEPPDLGPSLGPVPDDENWYMAFVSLADFVSLNGTERAFVMTAEAESLHGEWWRGTSVSSKAKALKKLDAILARHSELFARLLKEEQRTVWRIVLEETEGPLGLRGQLLPIFAEEDILTLYGLKIQRAFDQGEFMFALADLRVYCGICLALAQGADQVETCLRALEFRRRLMQHVLAFVSQLDPDQLKQVQQILERHAELFPMLLPQAFACEVARPAFKVEGRLEGRGLNLQMDKLAVTMEPLARLLKIPPEDLVKTMRGIPFVWGFSYHSRSMLAAYYEDAVKTHARLVQGRYKPYLQYLQLLSLRAERERKSVFRSSLLPNWVGQSLETVVKGENATLCRQAAQARFTLDAERVVVAAHRYRLDHGGTFPDNLQDLVPDYLKAVPDDPFGEGPLGFNAAQRTFHSVGESGAFDGVIPQKGLSELFYTDQNDVRRWHTPYLRRLDGTPLRMEAP